MTRHKKHKQWARAIRRLRYLSTRTKFHKYKDELIHSAFALKLDQALWETDKQPTIACLCGSTRFRDAFQQANLQETLAGRVVLSVGSYMHADSVQISAEQKLALDQLHLRKIDLADEILVINVGGYIGVSTRNEIAYAKAGNTPVRYWDSVE